MALRIHTQAPPFPASPRELLTPIQNPHRVKIYSLLKPWHPFFVFEVLTEDLHGSLSFSISIKDIESKGKKTSREFKDSQILGVFPWGSCPGDHSDIYDKFQLYVFECLSRLVADSLARSTREHRHMLQLTNSNSVNWTKVCKWFELLTDPLSPWFDRSTTVENGQMHFILSQTQAIKDGEPVCGWWANGPKGIDPCHQVLPIDIANLSISAIEAEVKELGNKAEATLKRHLLDQAVNALYYMRFKL